MIINNLTQKIIKFFNKIKNKINLILNIEIMNQNKDLKISKTKILILNKKILIVEIWIYNKIKTMLKMKKLEHI